MPIKLFLKFTASITSVIGLLLIFFPGNVQDYFLSVNNGGSEIFIRFLGSSLIGYTYLNWHTAKYKNLKQMEATLIGNLSTLMIAFLLSAIGILDGSLKNTGILILMLHLVFGFGFGYFLYELKSPQKK